MGTSYEQFLACLRNSAARRLLGIEMTDEEAVILGADGKAAVAYYEIWSAGRAGNAVASTTAIPQAHPAPLAERTLLDISTIGRGGEPATVRVTTSRLFISTTGGVSVWKAFLGAATLGLSTAVTGINAGVGGDLDIPIGAVSAALITRTGIAYSTVKLVIGGDALEFGLATIACSAVIGAINAAVSGGYRATAAAEAWEIYRLGRAKQWPSEGQLRRQLRKGQIPQKRFEHDVAVAHALQSLAMI
ncbi:hypothetical protein H9651_13400 [Microbacterium sp. Sa4CUA7]|uniref:Uncharacterized protein n=1 Tax=Microbacterium pullorum TaxID=2762236 RepID=A0ABR8S592_9MICO|nr:hypothetical protein [Microbacterium pullorum]MBD7958636.1 hypothetical protein [Microbacterium pullorum]